MALITDIQKLEPGSEVRLFEIDGSDYGADILRFHGHAIPHTPEELAAADALPDELQAKSIYWQGNQYAAWPVSIEGIGADSDGTATRPTFIAGNVNGRVTALCLAFEDLLKFKLTVRETMAQYLDAENFPDGNPTADPTQEALEIWFIDQKTGENGEMVQWDLSSPGEIDNHGLPGRQMTTYCHWSMVGGYRGPNCGYTGRLMFDDEDNPTDDPSNDICKGCLSSCKLRFGENEELPHGGFPARVPHCPELTMRKHILSAIQAQAAAEYPKECCGLLLAVGRKQQYFPCRNIASEPNEEFRLDPKDYAAAEDLGEVIGIVHSHPDATSRPSPHDLAMCEATALPWHILSWPEGDLRSITPTGQTPLLKRPFVHGAWDCWQVCADWYKREWGLEFEAFKREDGWWESAENTSLYEANYEAAGFVRVDRLQRGDLIVMAIGRTVHPNHAGIYLGDDPALPSEDSDVFGPGPFLLHHLYGRPSEVIVFGGPWLDRARLILRHVIKKC